MGRIRKPTNVTLDPELIEDLDDWIHRQPIRTGRSAVIEAAIRAFLDLQKDKRHAKPR